MSSEWRLENDVEQTSPNDSDGRVIWVFDVDRVNDSCHNPYRHYERTSAELLLARRSLSIGVIGVDLLPIPSVGLCVCVCDVVPESVLWQNGCVDPDAVWGGEWGQLRDGYIRWRW